MLTRPTQATAHGGRLSRRAWPAVFSVLLVGLGMAYTLAWPGLVSHAALWAAPRDIWSAYRSAHYIGWGDLGGVYAAGSRLVTFPGLLLLLAPLAMVTGAAGMTESFPFSLPHPTAWLVLGPYEIALSCLALFAADALAERLGVARGRRAVLGAAEVVALWNVSVVWGHPEDAVAVGLALYALVLGLDRRFAGAGWLFGAAVATQPLVLLMLPVLLALVGGRRAFGFVARTLAPAIGLLVVPAVSEFSTTFRALVDQPNYPNVDHRTPWTALAPGLGGHGQYLTVAAGPGRVLAIALACALGLWARRWRRRPDLLVWACALALALRCFTESVMDPFYVWPVLGVALVACSASSWARLIIGAAVVSFVTIYSNLHLSEWEWWLPVTGGIACMLWLGLPSGRMRLEGLPRSFRAAPISALPSQVMVGAAR